MRQILEIPGENNLASRPFSFGQEQMVDSFACRFQRKPFNSGSRSSELSCEQRHPQLDECAVGVEQLTQSRSRQFQQHAFFAGDCIAVIAAAAKGSFGEELLGMCVMKQHFFPSGTMAHQANRTGYDKEHGSCQLACRENTLSRFVGDSGCKLAQRLRKGLRIWRAHEHRSSIQTYGPGLYSRGSVIRDDYRTLLRRLPSLNMPILPTTTKQNKKKQACVC